MTDDEWLIAHFGANSYESEAQPAVTTFCDLPTRASSELSSSKVVCWLLYIVSEMSASFASILRFEYITQTMTEWEGKRTGHAG